MAKKAKHVDEEVEEVETTESQETDTEENEELEDEETEEESDESEEDEELEEDESEDEEVEDDSVEEDVSPAPVEVKAPRRSRGVLVLDRNVQHNGDDFVKGTPAKDLPNVVCALFEKKGFLERQ